MTLVILYRSHFPKFFLTLLNILIVALRKVLTSLVLFLLNVLIILISTSFSLGLLFLSWLQSLTTQDTTVISRELQGGPICHPSKEIERHTVQKK